MSIAEFSAALKDQAYKSWFKNSTKNILAKPASEYRKEAQQTKRTSFLLTTDTVVQLAEKLSGKELSKEQVEILLADLMSLVNTKGAEVIQEEILGGTKTITGIFFRQIAFEKGIDAVLQKSLQSIEFRTIIETDGTERKAKISDYFQKGHVFGVATNVTTHTVRNLYKSRITDTSKKQLIGTLLAVRNKLLRQDLATANIKDIKFSLYSKYLKTPYKYLIEMQIKEENREAGGDAAVYTNALRRYFSPENNAASIAKDLRNKSSAGDKFIGRLINVRGSPSFAELIAQEIGLTLVHKKANTTHSIPNTKIVTITKKIDTSKLKTTTKKSLAEINKAIQIAKALEIEGNTVVSPQSLETLLRSRLSTQIKQNMGTGNAKNVLNYRTGRFADSASIDHVSTSRAGMVSVFYNYMRNPYGTFSEGGSQQYPKTRDPKLLISKSIRELGASLAYNRMRAVLV